MNGISRLTLEQCAHITAFDIPHLSAVVILTTLVIVIVMYMTITHIPEKTRGLKYVVSAYNTISRF